MSSSEYERYRRTQSQGGRSLFAWLRELWSRPRPKPGAAEAEVVPFPVEAATRADRKSERGGPKAA
jgi:hypothetical protein